MTTKPLAKLISERGFDRFQDGLKSRFSAYRLEYELIYCEPTDNPAMHLDFESSSHFGQVTVWESGACEMEVIDIASGENVFYEHHQFRNEHEFHTTYPKLVLFMRTYSCDF